jgi:hypothetical protein
VSALDKQTTSGPIVPSPNNDVDDRGALAGMRICRRAEVLGDKLLQYHFVRHISIRSDLGSNPGRRDGTLATNFLSYVMAPLYGYQQHRFY